MTLDRSLVLPFGRYEPPTHPIADLAADVDAIAGERASDAERLFVAHLLSMTRETRHTTSLTPEQSR